MLGKKLKSVKFKKFGKFLAISCPVETGPTPQEARRTLNRESYIVHAIQPGA